MKDPTTDLFAQLLSDQTLPPPFQQYQNHVDLAFNGGELLLEFQPVQTESATAREKDSQKSDQIKHRQLLFRERRAPVRKKCCNTQSDDDRQRAYACPQSKNDKSGTGRFSERDQTERYQGAHTDRVREMVHQIREANEFGPSMLP